MTEFEYRPYTKIIINDILKSNFKDFVHAVAQKQIPPPTWADGILFSVTHAPVSGSLLEETIKEGKVYWVAVEFCKLEDFQASIVDGDTTQAIKVVNAQHNTILVEFAKWLKKEKRFWPDDV